MKRIETWLVDHSPWLIGILCTAIVILTGATAVFIFRSEDTRRIVTGSACAKDPASRECQRIRAAGAREQSIHTACITTRIAGLGCPALDHAHPHNAHPRKPTPTGNGGGNQTSAPTTAPQQPAPGDGGSGDTTVVVPPPDTNPPDNTPPPAEQSPTIVGPVLDGACQTVSQLGVPLC